MPNRAREYMDRILGRDEEFEDRDYRGRGHQGRFNRQMNTRGRRYEDYMDFNPEGTTRGFDYNVRENDDYNSFRDDDFYSERDERRNQRYGRNDSYTPGGGVRREGSSGIFRRTNSENRGFFGRGPKGWKWSDERVKDQVSEALYRDYNVDASEIEVDVKDGIVTLSGSVDSRESKRAAEECIENLNGVVDVHNRLRISDNNNVSSIRNETNVSEKRSLS